MANELAKQQKVGIATFLAEKKVHENVEMVVGKENVNGFVSDIVACVQNNNTLSKCTNQSILSGALIAKSINLPMTPQLGYAYLVPFQSKKTVEVEGKKQTQYVDEAQFQMGYKGYVQLALRSGNYQKLIATDIRKGEVVDYDPFEDAYTFKPIEFEKRMAKEKGQYIVPIIGYYAKFVLNNGFTKEMYMSKEDMLEYANKYSKAYRADQKNHTSYSFWTTKFDEMAKKTMLRQILGKWGLLTPDLQKAYTCDMAVIDEEGNPQYLDNQPDDTEPVENPMADMVIDGDFREIDDMPMQDNFK
jgi:recombination protein RecT